MELDGGWAMVGTWMVLDDGWMMVGWWHICAISSAAIRADQ